MPEFVINVASEADRLLLAGLPHLDAILEKTRDGVLVIGGLATAAWLHSSEVDLPIRPTRDVDLGISRGALRLTSTTQTLRPLLAEHGFQNRTGGESFRFVRQTDAGAFLLDLLLPKGASRDQPPLIEAGLDSIEAPGLAYAIARGPAHLALTLRDGDRAHAFDLPIATLDAMLVMKATLVADGARLKRDRRIIDTTDAVMLAAACTNDVESLRALQANRRRSEVRRAIAWLSDAFTDERSAAARRIEQHFTHELGRVGGAGWAVRAAGRLIAALNASRP
jgi:hypothetical protein